MTANKIKIKRLSKKQTGNKNLVFFHVRFTVFTKEKIKLNMSLFPILPSIYGFNLVIKCHASKTPTKQMRFHLNIFFVKFHPTAMSYLTANAFHMKQTVANKFFRHGSYKYIKNFKIPLITYIIKVITEHKYHLPFPQLTYSLFGPGRFPSSYLLSPGLLGVTIHTSI